MSRLFKALERAEQEGTLRQPSWSWQESSTTEDLQDAAAPSEAPAGTFTPPPEPQAKPRSGLDPRLITLLTPEAFETEPYRILGHMLKQLRQESGLRVVAITSPGAAEGKTTAAINLAGVLAQSSERRVLLLEAELRRPVMTSYLGLHRSGARRGLVEAILDESLALDRVVRPCPPYNLDVLPAGRRLASPYDLLRAPRLEALVTETRQHYDWVIVDAPPMVPFADCRLIEQWVDSFLVLVAAHRTPRKLLEESLATLDPGKITGLVFNRDEHLVPGYYSYGSYMPSPRRLRKRWQLPWRRKKTEGN